MVPIVTSDVAVPLPSLGPPPSFQNEVRIPEHSIQTLNDQKSTDSELFQLGPCLAPLLPLGMRFPLGLLKPAH